MVQTSLVARVHLHSAQVRSSLSGICISGHTPARATPEHLKDAAPRVALRFTALFSTLDAGLFRAGWPLLPRLNLNDNQPLSWTVARLKTRPAFNIMCCLPLLVSSHMHDTPHGFHDYVRREPWPNEKQ